MKTVGRSARTAREVARVRRSSRTQDLTLDQQTYPSVAPLADETVGVGMPVIVTFDVPVTDRASFEKHMTRHLDARARPGSWHWLSDTEAHWRPKTYWKAGTDVHVDVDINSVAGRQRHLRPGEPRASTSTSATPTSTRSTRRPTR